MRKQSKSKSWLDDAKESLDPFLDLATAREVLKCSKTTLWRRIRSGQLVSVRHGARVLIPRQALLALLGG